MKKYYIKLSPFGILKRFTVKGLKLGGERHDWNIFSWGDISEILRENVQAIDQLSNLRNTLDSVDVEDKDKEQLAINIVAQNLQQKGLSNKVIQAQIEDFIETGSLETEANTILDSHLELHGQAIEQKKQVELERVEKEKEDFKIFKKTISSTYKEFGLPDAIQKVLVENATKLDEYKIFYTGDVNIMFAIKVIENYIVDSYNRISSIIINNICLKYFGKNIEMTLASEDINKIKLVFESVFDSLISHKGFTAELLALAPARSFTKFPEES